MHDITPYPICFFLINICPFFVPGASVQTWENPGGCLLHFLSLHLVQQPDHDTEYSKQYDGITDKNIVKFFHLERVSYVGRYNLTRETSDPPTYWYCFTSSKLQILNKIVLNLLLLSKVLLIKLNYPQLPVGLFLGLITQK